MWIFEDMLILIYCCVIAGILGAVFGSFLNCAAWRVAHGESVTKGRSHCTSCGHVLSAPDLIPVFSWIFLGGKCRHCGAKVSVRYLLAELFMAAVFVLTLLQGGMTVLTLRNLILACLLFLLSMVDLEIFEIPDSCIVIALLLWAVTAPFLMASWAEVGWHVLAAVIYGGGMLAFSLLFDRIMGRETMGGGDIKLYAVAGLYLGLLPGLFTLILSCFLGLAFAAVCRSRIKEADGQIPFGPAIALASWLMLLYGDLLAGWYLGLMGL